MIVQALDLLETELDDETWPLEYKDLPDPCDLAADVLKKLGDYSPLQVTGEE